MQSDIDIDVALQRLTARSAAEGRRIAALWAQMLEVWREAGGVPFSRAWH